MEVRTATPDDVVVIVETAARALDAEAMLHRSFGGGPRLWFMRRDPSGPASTRPLA